MRAAGRNSSIFSFGANLRSYPKAHDAPAHIAGFSVSGSATGYWLRQARGACLSAADPSGHVSVLRSRVLLPARAQWEAADGPRWRLLPWVLLAGFALRLLVALTSDYTWRPDEVMQYLEQAHWVVFGYGVVPWEYVAGARTWLVSVFPMAVLQACAWFGMDQPDNYIPIMRTANATASLAVPVGAYVVGRRMCSETAGRAACIFGCFWYELIVLAPHTLAELYASYLFFSAWALLKRNMGPVRSLAAGLLLGLAIAVRVPYAVAVVPFGLLLLMMPLQLRSKMAGVAGAVLGLAGWGLLDRLTLGGWFSSLFTLLDHIPGLRDGTVPRAEMLAILFWPSLGLLYLAAIWILLRWRRLLPVSVPFLLVFAFHVLYRHASEYSNFALVIMLAGAGTAFLWAEASPNLAAALSRPFHAAGAAVVAVLSALSLMGFLPGYTRAEPQHNNYFFATTPDKVLFRSLAREPADAIKALLYDEPHKEVVLGGFYYLHQDVPVYFPWRELDDWQETIGSGREPASYASHVITTLPECFPGFDLKETAGPMHLLERAGGNPPPPQRQASLIPGMLAAGRLPKDEDFQSDFMRWHEGCLTEGQSLDRDWPKFGPRPLLRRSP